MKLKNIGAFLFIMGCFSLLLFYFDVTFLYLAELLIASAALGLIGKAIEMSFFGFVLPSEPLYRQRFKMIGIFFGLMIGLVVLINNFLTPEPVTIIGALIGFGVAIGLGLLFNARMASHRFHKRMDAVDERRFHDIRCSDTAQLIDADGNRNSGLLVLTDERLAFFSADDDTLLFDEPISALHPEIKNSSFFPFPIGFTADVSDVAFLVKFPRYWMQHMRPALKTATRPSTT